MQRNESGTSHTDTKEKNGHMRECIYTKRFVWDMFDVHQNYAKITPCTSGYNDLLANACRHATCLPWSVINNDRLVYKQQYVMRNC